MSQKVDTFSRQNDGNGAGCRRPRLSKMTKQIGKSFFCLLLCAVLVVGTSYKRPVHAVLTGSALITGAVVVSSCLAALGIVPAVDALVNGKSYGQACQDIWNGLVDDIKTDVQGTIELVDNYKAQFKATGTLLRAVFDGACQEIPQVTDFGNITKGSSLQSKLGWEVYSPSSNYGWPSQFNFSGYSSWRLVTQGSLTESKFTQDVGGVRFTLDGTSGWQCRISHSNPDGYVVMDVANITSSHNTDIGAKYAVLTATLDGVLHYFIFFTGLNYPGWDVFSGGSVVLPKPAQDLFNPATDKIYADGKSAMNTKVDDVIDGIQDKVGVANPDTGEVEIPLTAPNVGSADDPDVVAQSQSDVLGKDIADDSDRDRDRDTNKDRDTSAPKPSDIPDLSLPDVLIKKFPFSLPWDLYNSVAILVSPGEAPKWEVPFKIQSMGIDESFTLDMSQFDPLAAIIRWGLSLLFLISLIILTNKLIKH